jgi:S-adenosylmethionine decarboxylase
MLEKKMIDATEKTHATVLSSTKEEFPGGGFSMVILVSESHSSIHTYPEHKACFVDIFTCGTSCKVENFDIVLEKYLRPGKVNKKIMIRS